MRKLLIGYRVWEEQNRHLDRMTLTDLLVACLTHPAIQLNMFLAALALIAALVLHQNTALLLLIVVLAVPVYSLVEYLLHRFVLHSRVLYRFKSTAALWKRVHFDHHQDTSDLAVLFGDPKTTLPPILLIAAPLGYIIHGIAGSAAAVFCGIVLVSVYEFCHCYQHLAYEPKNTYLKRLKKRHLAHHFHNETGNFGITTHVWDLVFGTNYENNRERPRSATVRNLGYAGGEAMRFPWVAELSRDNPGADR